MIALYALLGPWRSWLGGGIGKDWPTTKGLTAIQDAALLALVMLANLPHWQFGLVDFAGILLLARGYGHGPMLQYPLGPKDSDMILRLVGGAGGGTLRYLAYAVIRYVGFAVPWTGFRVVCDVPGWWAPLAGAAVIVVSYAVFTRLAKVLPTFTTPGDEAANWSELVGWTLAGLIFFLSTTT